MSCLATPIRSVLLIFYSFVLYIDLLFFLVFFFFSSRRRHTRFSRDWSSDVCSSDLIALVPEGRGISVTVSVGKMPRPSGTSAIPCAAMRCVGQPVTTLPRTRTSPERSEERRVGKECRSRRWP